MVQLAQVKPTIDGNQIDTALLIVEDNILPLVKVKLSTTNTNTSGVKLTHFSAVDRNIVSRQNFVSTQQYTHLQAGTEYFVSLLELRVTSVININLACEVYQGSGTTERTINVELEKPIEGLDLKMSNNENIVKGKTFSLNISSPNILKDQKNEIFNQSFDDYPLVFSTIENGAKIEVGRLHLIFDNTSYLHLNLIPNKYDGTYGCDWMKPEYNSATTDVFQSRDTPQTPANRIKTPLCVTPVDLEQLYVPETFYHKTYYPTWLTFIPDQNKEYKFKLKQKVFEGVVPKGAIVELRWSSNAVQIYQKAASITNGVLRITDYKENKDIDITIKCVNSISNTLGVDIVAIFPPNNVESVVGKFYVEANNHIREIELLFVHLQFSDKCNKNLGKKYKPVEFADKIKNKSLNQLMVSCTSNNISTPIQLMLPNNIMTNYGLTKPAKTIYCKDGSYTFNMPTSPGEYRSSDTIRATNNIDSSNMDQFCQDITSFVRGELTNVNNTYLTPRQTALLANHNLKVIILLNVIVQSSIGLTLQDRFETGSLTNGEAIPNGDMTPIYCENLKNDSLHKTVIHEIGHLLGIRTHPFENGRTPRFLQGYTNFFMDYDDDEHGNDVNVSKEQFSKSEWVVSNNQIV